MNDRDRDRGGREREDIGVDPLLDRAIAIIRELFDVVRAAERGVDDTVRDLQKARQVERAARHEEREADALERKAESIEREALGDLTGTTERREGERGGDGWRGWWSKGDGYLRDIDDGFRRMKDGRMDRDGYSRIGRSFKDFDDHFRGYNRGWDGWDDRYGPVFDDWGRRWGAMRGRYDGRDWSRGDWRTHSEPYRQLYNDFDGFRSHYGRTYGEWGRRMKWPGNWDDVAVYRDGLHRSPGTELGGSRY